MYVLVWKKQCQSLHMHKPLFIIMHENVNKSWISVSENDVMLYLHGQSEMLTHLSPQTLLANKEFAEILSN